MLTAPLASPVPHVSAVLFAPAMIEMTPPACSVPVPSVASTSGLSVEIATAAERPTKPPPEPAIALECTSRFRATRAVV